MTRRLAAYAALLAFALFSSTFMAASAHAADCNLKLYTSIDLLSDSAAVFDVQIQHKPYRMALNVSSFASEISKPVADDLHLTLRAFPRNVHITRGQQDITQYAEVPSITLGTVELTSSTLDAVPNWPNPNIAGNFGSNILSKLDVELDFSHKKINLFSQDHCPGQVVYWTDSYTSVPYENGRLGNAVFKVTADGVDMDGTISTTSPVSMLNLRTAKNRLDMDVDASNPVSTAFGLGYRTKLKKLEFGGITIMNPDVVLAPQPACDNPSTLKGTASVDGYEKPDCGLTPVNIGVDVLKKLRIYIASKEKKIYISAASATKAADASAPAAVQKAAEAAN